MLLLVKRYATDADTTSFHGPTNTMIMSIDQHKRDASLLLRACACGCKCCDLSPFLRMIEEVQLYELQARAVEWEWEGDYWIVLINT